MQEYCLRYLINRSTLERCQNVVPLFKRDCKESPGNYEPVSLTSFLGKLLERILRAKKQIHLEKELISDKQHDFVHGKYYLASLIEIFEEVTKEVVQGRGIDVAHMDFCNNLIKGSAWFPCPGNLNHMGSRQSQLTGYRTDIMVGSKG